MRAVLAHGPGDFRLTELPTPDGPWLLDVEATGVCAADRMLWTGRHPWGELPWPFVPGHEVLARVVHGPLPTGTRVTTEVLLPDGRHLGSGIPGGFAEQLALPAEALVHPVPDALTREQAVLAEPMACVLHAVRRAGVRPGDRVLVAGLGGLGALAATAARAEGAEHVTALVRSLEKGCLAGDLGYDDWTTDPVASAYDVGIDVSGDVAAVDVLLGAVRAGGRLGVYGVYDRPWSLDLNRIAEHGERQVTGGHLGPGCFPDAIALLERVDGALVVTGTHPLEGLTEALTKPAPRLKEIVVP